MDSFFTKLSDWDDGDGDVDATINAGTGLMMSFMGQQDKAEQVTDGLSKVMNFIKPFSDVINPIESSLGSSNYPGSSPGGFPVVEFTVLLQRIRYIIYIHCSPPKEEKNEAQDPT